MEILRLIIKAMLVIVWLTAFFVGYLVHNTVWVIIPLAVLYGCTVLLAKL